ncbi:hypothetical protein LUZ60_003340 [Juncus effusus]|nr:hypothetical protein LUZ60_003340 [Juncus effusus]
MSVEMLDGATILNFIEDENAFNSTIEARFANLDSDGNGRLTYAELVKELMSLRILELPFESMNEPSLSHDEIANVYRGLFERFDRDGDGTVDLEEFKVEMREVMLAVASGLGSLPVQMVVEEGSFLKRAIEKELASTSL